jgi:hypothetical protein
MQRCVDFALDHQRQRLVAEVAANALTLSQDPYGNYVVQYILDLKTAWSSTEVMARLEGNYAFLSMQKFSSNVVEKCLKLGVEEPRSRLVQELMTSPHLGQLLQDQYANYVIQSALSVCKVLTLSADSKTLFDSTVLHHNLLLGLLTCLCTVSG